MRSFSLSQIEMAAFRKLILFISVALATVLCVSTVNAQQVLRWGADPSGGAPYVFNDPNHPDQYIGYEKEMVDALAAAMVRKPEFVPSDWETLVSALQRGSFDVIVNGLVNSLADCRNRVVGTLGNTAASRLLQKEGIPMRGYADPVAAYRDLELQRIDAVLMDVPAEVFYASKSATLKRAGEPFFRGTYNIGLRKSDDALKAEVDAAIDKIIHDGTLEQILRKWNLWNDAQTELLGPNRSGQPSSSAGYEITSAVFNWREAVWRLTRAAMVTVLIAFGSMLIAVVLGMPLAIGQSKGPAWVQWVCSIYIEFFRGTPVLVQLLFLYFGLPTIGLAMPGSLEAIPRGQWEAAYLLGMNPLLAFRRIILPQAFRIALPPMTNDFVSLFKDTSVAYAISVWELATAYRELANASGQFLLLGVAVSLFYLAMSLPMAHLARRLERRLQRREAIEAEVV